MSVELATAAVGVLAPYLAEAGKEAAKTVGKESAEGAVKLLGWLRGKLTGRGKEALTELEEAPASALNQDDLRTQLAKLLEKQPALGPELAELLGETGGRGDTMTQTVGTGGKASMIKGSGNNVRIG
jgi:hypothetical protein